MIRITETIRTFMDTNEQIVIRPNKVIVKPNRAPTSTIPSKQYPLYNKKSIQFFHSVTTEPLTDARALEAFDATSFEVGRCYANMEKLVKSFEKAGLDEDLTVYTGWMVMPNDLPIHHAWAIYKGTHLLDPSARHDHYALLKAQSESKSKESLRQDIARIQKNTVEAKNSKVMTCGQSIPIFVYIGSETSPQEGREVFNKLTETYPNHPSYAKEGMNQFGESTLQAQLRKQS